MIIIGVGADETRDLFVAAKAGDLIENPLFIFIVEAAVDNR